MKIWYLALVLPLGFGMSLSAALPVQADYVTDEIQRTNDLINEAGQHLREVEPLVQQREVQKHQLSYSCNLGNTNACNQLNAIEQQELNWIIENDCRYRTGLNSCYR